MRTTRQAATRGALFGAAGALPVGVLAGLFLRGVLFADTRNAQSTGFVVMVTFVFVAWGVFIGGMLAAQARGTEGD